MELRSDFETLCERYLLGELSESEAERLEKTYFEDDASFERFLAVKDELLDAYARGDLKGRRRDLFEQHYLASKARRRRVDESRALIQAASAAGTNIQATKIETYRVKKTDSANFLRWFSSHFSFHPMATRAGLVAASLVILIGGWLIVRQTQDQPERASQQPRETRPANGNVADERAQGPVPISNQNTNARIATASPSPSRSVGDQRQTRNTSKVNVEKAPKAPTPTNQNTNAQLAASTASPARSTQPAEQITSITLEPITTRDPSEPNAVILIPDAMASASHDRPKNPRTRQTLEPLVVSNVPRVQLNLIFYDAAYNFFELSVRDMDGTHVVKRRGLKASPHKTGKIVSITINADLLLRRIRPSYIATLRGYGNKKKSEIIGEYYFQVRHTAP